MTTPGATGAARQSRRYTRIAMDEVVAERQQLDQHAQELVLRESVLAARERLHGSLDQRSADLRQAEAVRTAQEDDLAQRTAEAAASSELLRAQLADETKKCDDLVRPLLARERRCLEWETKLREEAAAQDAALKGEWTRLAETREAARALQDRAQELHGRVAEARGRVVKREEEVSALREAAEQEAAKQRQRNEEHEQRARAVEWRQKELQEEEARMTQRDRALRRVGDELERTAGWQQRREADLDAREAALASEKLEVRHKIATLLQAEADGREAAAALRTREAAAETREAGRAAREAALCAVERTLRERDAALGRQAATLAAQERRLQKAGDDVGVRLRVVETGEADLLAWLRELSWRERQPGAGLGAGGACRCGRTAQAASPAARDAAASAVDAAACLSGRLHTAKAAYLARLGGSPGGSRAAGVAAAAGGRAGAADAAGSGGSEDAFQRSQQERSRTRAYEDECRRLLKVFRRYGTAQGLGGGGGGDGGSNGGGQLLQQPAELTADERKRLREAVERDGALAGEQQFLKAFARDSPFAARRNSTPDATLVREFSEWYARLRRVTHARYVDVLAQRTTTLADAVAILRRRVGEPLNRGGRIRELLSPTKGGGEAGGGGSGGGGSSSDGLPSLASVQQTPPPPSAYADYFLYKPSQITTERARLNRLCATPKVSDTLLAVVRKQEVRRRNKLGLGSAESQREYAVSLERAAAPERGTPTDAAADSDESGPAPAPSPAAEEKAKKSSLKKPSTAAAASGQKRLSPLDRRMHLAELAASKPFSTYLTHYFEAPSSRVAAVSPAAPEGKESGGDGGGRGGGRKSPRPSSAGSTSTFHSAALSPAFQGEEGLEDASALSSLRDGSSDDDGGGGRSEGGGDGRESVRQPRGDLDDEEAEAENAQAPVVASPLSPGSAGSGTYYSQSEDSRT